MAISVDADWISPERARFVASALVEPGKAHSPSLAFPALGIMPVLNGVMGTTCRIVADFLRHF